MSRKEEHVKLMIIDKVECLEVKKLKRERAVELNSVP